MLSLHSWFCTVTILVKYLLNWLPPTFNLNLLTDKLSITSGIFSHFLTNSYIFACFCMLGPFRNADLISDIKAYSPPGRYKRKVAGACMGVNETSEHRKHKAYSFSLDYRFKKLQKSTKNSALFLHWLRNSAEERFKKGEVIKRILFA